MRRVMAQVILMSLAGLFAAGCSNFKSKRGIDMGPFADNTVTMLAEAQKIVEPLDWNYLREYRPARDDSLVVKTDVLRRIFGGIGFYSIQVVSLNSSHLSGRERSDRLAEYLEQVCRPIANSGGGAIGLTTARLDSVLANIRAQPEFLDALGQADPIVYPIVSYAVGRVERLAADVRVGLQETQYRINAEFAETLRQTEALNALEDAQVRTYLMLQDYRVGRETLEAVVAHDPSLARFLGAKGKTREEAAEDAQNDLLARLASLDTVRKQLDRKNVLYAAQRAELDDFNDEITRRVRSANLMLLYWLRAHRNLSQGIEIPPAIDLGAIAASSAKKATRVLP